MLSCKASSVQWNDQSLEKGIDRPPFLWRLKGNQRYILGTPHENWTVICCGDLRGYAQINLAHFTQFTFISWLLDDWSWESSKLQPLWWLLLFALTYWGNPMSEGWGDMTDAYTDLMKWLSRSGLAPVCNQQQNHFSGVMEIGTSRPSNTTG